jgi:hypothetical protein
MQVEYAGICRGTAALVWIVGCGAMVAYDVDHGRMKVGDEKVEVIGREVTTAND